MNGFVSYIYRFSIQFGYEPHGFYDIDRITLSIETCLGKPVSYLANGYLRQIQTEFVFDERGSRGCVFQISISICRAGVPYAAAASQTRTIEPSRTEAGDESSSTTWHFRCKAADGGARVAWHLHTYVYTYIPSPQRRLIVSYPCFTLRRFSIATFRPNRISRISPRPGIKSVTDRETW